MLKMYLMNTVEQETLMTGYTMHWERMGKEILASKDCGGVCTGNTHRMLSRRVSIPTN